MTQVSADRAYRSPKAGRCKTQRGLAELSLVAQEPVLDGL